MSDQLYSASKAAWHIERIQALREGRQIVPVTLQLNISDLCNQNCSWCAYRADRGLSVEQFADEGGNRNPNRMIPQQKVREILEDAAAMGVQGVIFTGGGEPTVHPHHLALFRFALDLGMDCSLNTNGVLHRPGWEEVLPRLTYVRYSIDAGSPEEYAEVRDAQTSHYETALANMSDLARRVEKVSSRCVVGAGYVVSPTTWHHLERGVINIRDTGAHYVRLASMQSTGGRAAYGDSYEEARTACRRAEALSDGGFRVVNMFDAAMGGRPDYRFCGMQQFVLYVGGNLKVYRCCYTAYMEHGEIGDLTGQSLRYWFESDKKRAMIAAFDARSCEACALNEKNRAINQMVGTPDHVNFI
ncbi:radical SAM protein [Gemmatimonadota bacterium]